MNKKFFTIGMAVLLGVSLSFLGCDDKAEETTEPTAAELAAELAETLGSGAKVDETDDTKVNVTGTVAVDKTVTVPAGVTLDVTADGTLNIAEKASITVEGGAKLILSDGADGTNNGTITIKSGGASYDMKSGGGSLTGSADTQEVIEAGGKVYIGGNSDTTDLRIGSTSDAKAIIQLVNGAFTGKSGVYTLSGDAFIRGGYGLHHQKLVVKAGKTLTIELMHKGARANSPYGVFLWSDTADDTTIEGETGARIIVKSPASEDLADGFIHIVGDAVANFYDSAGTVIDNEGVVGAGTYEWKADAGSEDDAQPGWKKTT